MITHIVGNRPQFIKLAALYHELEKEGCEQNIIHSGQHYDENMSDVFLENCIFQSLTSIWRRAGKSRAGDGKGDDRDRGRTAAHQAGACYFVWRYEHYASRRGGGF